MAKRRRKGIDLSLFPFLSVLVCMIGTLSLIIIGTTLGTAGARMDPFKIPKWKLKLATLQAGIDRVDTQIELQKKRIAKCEWHKARAPGLREAVGKLNESRELEAAVSARLKKHVASVTSQGDQAHRRVEELERRYRQRRPKIEIPKAIAGKEPFNPVLIDCRRDGIVILQSGTRVATKDISLSVEVERLLRNLQAAKGSWCAFLLVRSDGIEAFNKMHELVRENRVRYGFHPVLTRKEFDVSDLQRPDWLK